jgi:hypothetical protein
VLQGRRATDVEFRDGDEPAQSVSDNRAVVLSAGVPNSPKIKNAWMPPACPVPAPRADHPLTAIADTIRESLDL